MEKLQHRTALTEHRVLEEITDIIAGTEAALRALEQQHVHVFVNPGLGKNAVEVCIHRIGQGVVLVNTGEFDVQDIAGKVSADEISHGRFRE